MSDDFPAAPIAPAAQGALPELPVINTPQQVTPEQQSPVQEEMVNAFNPEGKLVSIPSTQLQRAVEDEGYRPATDKDAKAQELQDKYGSGWQQAITGVEHAASAATFGVSTGFERMLGVKGADIRGRTEANPKSAIAGSVVGLVGTSFIPGLGEASIANDVLSEAKLAEEAAIVAKKSFDVGATSAESVLAANKAAEATAARVMAEKTAAEALNPISATSIMANAARRTQEGLGIGQGAGTLNAMKAAAVRGAVENTLFSGGDILSRTFAGDPPETFGSAVAELGLSGVIGGAFSAPFGAVSPLWKATSESKVGQWISDVKDDWVGGESATGTFFKKVLAHFGGVNEDQIDHYLANAAEVNASPEKAAIRDQIVDHLSTLNNNVIEGKMTVDEAEKAYKSFARQQAAEWASKSTEPQIAAKEAKGIANAALGKFKETVKNNALAKSPEIHNAVENLANLVYEGSRGAYDLLNQSKQKVPLGNFYNKAAELINKLRSSPIPEDAALAGKLEGFVEGARELYGKKWQSGATLKNLIQRLDEHSEYRPGAAAFDSGMSRYYKQLRWTLDHDLKEAIPEYREYMKPLANDTKLLQRVANFDTPEGAVRRISQLTKQENYMNEMTALRELEKRVGGSFVKDLEPYANPKVKEGLRKAIPELAEAEKAQAIADNLKDPRMKLRMKEELEKILSESEPKKMLESAKQTLAEAVAKQKDVRGLTPATIEGKLRSAQLDKAHAKELLEKLPKFVDENGTEHDLIKLLKNVDTREAFLKHGRINGSRMVNTFGVIGGGVGEMLFNHVIGGGLAGVGVAHILENAGPAGVKKILDFYIKHGGKLDKTLTTVEESSIRQMLAKVIDGTQSVSAKGFKAGLMYSAAALAGEEKLDKNAKNVFDDRKEVNIETDTKKLKKNLEHHSQNPVETMQGVGGDIHHYFPDHRETIAGTSAGAVAYLQSQKFNRTPASTFDSPPVENDAEKAQYERTLGIAENPSNVLGYIKNGQLTPKDIQDLQGMYPALYKKMSDKLVANMTDAVHDGRHIPYATRINISMFLAQPLDSTMQPMSIQAAQPIPKPPPPQGPGKSTKNLGNMAKASQTQSQARESDQKGA